MNRKKYEKWKLIREKGIIKYILKYFIRIGLLVPMILILIDMLNGFFREGNIFYYYKEIIVDLKYKLPIFILTSIFTGLVLWLLNEKMFNSNKLQ